MKTLAALTSLLLSCSPALAGLAGVWNATATSEQGDRDYTVTLSGEGDKLAGKSVAVADGTDRTIDRITISETNVTFEFDFESDGNQGIIKVVADKKSPTQLDGKWTITGTDGTVYMSGAWRADKETKFSLAGEWDSLGTSDNGDEYPSLLNVTDSAADTVGKFVNDDSEIAIDSIKIDGTTVTLSFALDMDGLKIPTTIEAEATGDDSLKGKWIIKDAEGEIAATGPWNATRKPAFAIAGSWTAVAALPEGDEYNGTLDIEQSGDSLTGTSQTDGSDETTTMNSLKFDGKNFSYSVPFEFDGQSGTVTVEATVEGTDTLTGRWTLTGPDGSEVATDTMTAKRQ